MEVTLKELLENGIYFGHPSRQFDPRMRPYLYGKRQGIYIIDIEATQSGLIAAGEFLRSVAASGKQILFVGTKKQAQATVQELAEQCGMPYVTYRWIGGTLTNSSSIRSRIARLDEIEQMIEMGRLALSTKKEETLILKERQDLLRKFGGIRNMPTYPGALIVVDVRREAIAVAEARKVGIPIVGIVDTNGNPELVDFPIPANDDGLKAIRLLLSKLTECILEGKAEAEYRNLARAAVAAEQQAATQSIPEGAS